MLVADIVHRLRPLVSLYVVATALTPPELSSSGIEKWRIAPVLARLKGRSRSSAGDRRWRSLPASPLDPRCARRRF